MNFPKMIRYFSWLPNLKILNYAKWAVLASPAFILVYIAVFSLLIIKYFEKTHAPEIVYYTIFLAFMIVESTRLFLPALGLWLGNYLLLILISKIVFFCRLAGSTIMLCGAALSSTKADMQDSSLMFGLTALAVVTACFIPVDSLKMHSTWVTPTAYYTLFLVIRFLFTIATSISFWITAEKNEANEYKQAAVFIFMLSTGLVFLQESDNLLFFAVGAFLLSAGTYGFLKALHKYYLWK
ncbi:MAG: hypothetical protein GX297_10415 [Treponema sp.]|jgi:hypothetical protein|nr:hypothetical protein [Treponema sp.]